MLRRKCKGPAADLSSLPSLQDCWACYHLDRAACRRVPVFSRCVACLSERPYSLKTLFQGGLVSRVQKGPPCSPASGRVWSHRGLWGHLGAPGLGHHHISTPTVHISGSLDLTQVKTTVFSAVYLRARTLQAGTLGSNPDRVAYWCVPLEACLTCPCLSFLLYEMETISF